MKQKSYSLRVRVMVICLLTTLVTVVIFMVYGVYNVFRYREDFLNTNRYVADFYASELKRDMESLQSYTNSILTTNVHYGMLSHTKISEKNKVWAEYYLSNALESKATSLQQYGGLFYYDKVQNTMRSQFSDAFLDDELYFLNVALKSWLQEHVENVGSQFVELEGRLYYISVVGGPERYVGFFLELDRYFLNSLSSEEGEAQILFLDGDGKVLSWVGEEILSEDKVLVTERASWVSGHNYALVKSSVIGGSLELALVRPFWQFLHFWTDWRFWVFLVAIPLVGVCFFFVVYQYFYKILLCPADRLVQRVKWMEEQGEKIQLEQSPIVEFREIENRVDEMVARISTLQKESYLAQMEKQNAQVQTYKLQIQPHFYLNCLKTMDALLENGEYVQLRPFILCLSHYMRSRFREVLDMVTLEEEIKTATSYYSLMTLLHNEPTLFRMDADERARRCRIPHFCVQMFLENSFKYAKRAGRILSIHMQASFLQEEGEEFLLLRISDNGDGYPMEKLKEWNDVMPHPGMDTEHIGINNLRYRIRLLYNGKGKVVFYNGLTGGAVTEIILPVKEEEWNESACH
ncbi:putative uncharacterized protein [Clostridium sp. CAG:1013]|nr:putative uncharacterized protein [Clostridium sp. CAG:1013]